MKIRAINRVADLVFYYSADKVRMWASYQLGLWIFHTGLQFLSFLN